MHFLGGEREFIKPENIDRSIEEQLDQCFVELESYCTFDRIYKLNFFVSTVDDNDYKKVQSYILEKVKPQLRNEILVNVIAQAPLTRKVILEVFTYDPEQWETTIIPNPSGKSILFRSDASIFLLGSVQSNGNKKCEEQSTICFSAINEMLTVADFSMSDLIRQWNYIQNIILFDGSNQNYQDFNNVRSNYYGDSFLKNGYPAATGIGINEGGVIIEFIAMQSELAKTCAIDNPDQIAAHVYSENVLVGQSCDKTTPKFERARYLKCMDRQMMFLSGTAAILGEKTIGIGDPAEQTRVTILNLKKLYSEAVLKKYKVVSESLLFNHCRVYIRHIADFPIIEKTCRRYFGDIPMVFIQADICRDNLLVEIEGEVIL